MLGYKLLCEIHDLNSNRPQASNSQKFFWKSIWKMKVPGKIKHFLWKACTNLLLTKENLMKCKILQESVCHHCSRDSEDVVHTLWGCECLKVVWDSEFGWVDKNLASSDSFSDLLQRIQDKLAFLPLFTTTAWSIWYQHNKSRLQENSLPLKNIAGFAKDYICEFKNLGYTRSNSRQAVPRGWHPLAEDELQWSYIQGIGQD